MKRKLEIPTKPTLADMLNIARISGDVEIINECNETLLIANFVEDYVVSLDKVLSEDLLKRDILSYGTRDNRTLFKVSGMEDAE